MSASDVTYSQFFEHFLLKNRPGILTGVTGAWNCARLWVPGGSLDVSYFRDNYGEVQVPVSDCGKKWFNVQEKSTMVMKDYLSYWEGRRKDECLYLKDWHFTKAFPTQDMYRVPRYFASDWLNEYYDNNKHLNDDFRFVYIGPKGSWTPFHSDVLTSFSWSANVSGRKKWILLPPGDEDYFRDDLGHLKYDLDASDRGDKARIFEITQEAGEVVFVPSGWHHQVWNLEDAVSVNHNWINACNIGFVWESLKNSLKDVKREISDFEGAENWGEDCQTLLQATFGFSYRGFYEFLRETATARMDSLREGKPLTVYGNWSFGRSHLLFDLKRVSAVLRCLLDDGDFRALNSGETADDAARFLNLLLSFLERGI